MAAGNTGMKKRHLLSSILLGFVALAAFAEPGAANLVLNPGFESGDGSGLPPSWRSDEWNPGMTRFVQASDGAYRGSRYVRIQSDDEDDAKLIQRIAVKPGSLYRISVMARAKADRADRRGAYVSVLNIFDGSNEARDTQGAWTELSLYGRTGPGQASIELCLRLGGYSSLNSGWADFDEVRVSKIDRLPEGANAIALSPPSGPSSSAPSAANSDPLAVFLFLLALFGLAYLFDRSRAAPFLDSAGKGRVGALVALSCLLAAGIALRLRFSFGGHGYPSELGALEDWAERAWASRLAFFYRAASPADCPPGYALLLAPIGGLRSLFDLSAASPGAEFLIRIPSLACDLGLAMLAYRVVGGAAGRSRGLLACAAVVLNPLAILGGAVWGSYESAFCLCLAASLAGAKGDKPLRAGIAYGLAILMKPLALAFLPVFILLYASRKKTLPAARFLVACIGASLLGFLPFMAASGPDLPLEYFASAYRSIPFATLNAANFWGACGQNGAPVGTAWLGLSLGAWGTIAAALLVCFSVLVYRTLARKGPEGRDPVFETAAFLALGIFCFGARMGPRDLSLAPVLLLFAWSGRAGLRTFWLAIAQSLLGFLSLSLVYRLARGNLFRVPALDPLFIVLSILNVLSFLAFLGIARAEPEFARAERDERGPGRWEGRILEPGRYALIGEASEAEGKRYRAIGIGCLTALCLVFALQDLGDLRVPEKGWKPTRTTDAVLIDLGAERQVDAVSWYSGIGEGEFLLRSSLDGSSWSPGWILKPALYSWATLDVKAKARYLELRPKSLGGNLLETAFWKDGEGRPLEARGAAGPTPLLDEQGLAKRYARYTDSMVFDEIYHGRTAYEHIHRLEPYEWTHPPLGKLIIAIGIELFGMGPFGWRIMCALFGALLVPAFYGLARQAFPKGNLALGAAAAYAFDFMRLTQTRLALIDGYVTLFVLGSYLFMWRYYLSALDRRRPDYPSLAASGLFFGLGAATKWNAIYSGAGLAVLFFIAFVGRLRADLKAGRRGASAAAGASGVLGLCVLCFILLPLAIYVAAYVPTLLVPGHDFGSIWRYQGRMYTYHSTLKAEHPFASSWWQWPWLVKPVWYFKGEGLPAWLSSTIVAHGNPLVWWPSLASAIAAAFIALRRKDGRILPAILGFFAQYLPWTLVPRLTFLYHYFPILPFGLICAVYCAQALLPAGLLSPPVRSGAGARPGGPAAWFLRDWWIWIYGAACALLFAWFFPALTGAIVPSAWIWSLRWLPSWFF